MRIIDALANMLAKRLLGVYEPEPGLDPRFD